LEGGQQAECRGLAGEAGTARWDRCGRPVGRTGTVTVFRVMRILKLSERTMRQTR
jgi:hypothetical protein